MFVSCSTLCFTREPLESALRHIVELEFTKVELAIHENGPHLRPSDVAESADAALHRLRSGPSLACSAFDLDFGDVDPRTYRKRFDAVCRFAKPLSVAVLTIPAAPLGKPLADEIQRLSELSIAAQAEGLVLCVKTDMAAVTASPADTLALCQSVPGLSLTLDPSAYINGPNQNANFDELVPLAQNMHFRDSSKKPGEFQLRIGQGQIEYGRIVSQLERNGYRRALTVAILDGIENPFEVEVEVRKLKLLLESLL